MALGANSYGSVAGVAAFVPLYTISGSFSTSTLPLAATVESWLDQVSALANGSLANNGFTIPVTQADVLLSLTGVINQHVADLCHASHGTGRFMTERALTFGLAPMYIIREEMDAWIASMAAGWEALGASRGASPINQVGVKSEDEDGNEIFPIFQREGFGNEFDNWSGE